jgi:hypothetical protein
MVQRTLRVQILRKGSLVLRLMGFGIAGESSICGLGVYSGSEELIAAYP